ncbi:ATP-binding protein [Flavobacterium qiangtangense]|uniref:histidine kinase n=1 Tax=Flavobacterium qiangtangense TaxID=1442595 RepID=A0ABW1PJQ9_9FLAO
MRNLKSCSRTVLAIVLFIAATAAAQTSEIVSLQKGLARSKDSVAYVDRLNRIGMLMHLKSPDSCVFYGMRARAVAGRIGYLKGGTDSDNVIGIALALKGLNNEALQMFGRVLQDYRRYGDSANVAQVYMNFASTSMQLGREKDAIAYSRHALRAGASIPGDSIMGKVYTNYCIANPRLQEDSVRYYIGRSNRIAAAHGDEELLIGNSQVLALFYLSRGERAAALPLLTTALDQARAAGLERLQLIGLNLLAIYHEPKNPALSLELTERQYRLAEAKGYDELKAEVLFSMRRYAALAGQSAKRLEINDALVSALLERQARLGNFIGDYVSYGQLQEDYEGLEKSEKLTRRTAIVLTCLSVAGIILSLLLLRAHLATRREARQKAAINSVVEQQNRQLRTADQFKTRLVSILAHDFRSPLISTLYLIRILKGGEALEEEMKFDFFEKLDSEISGLLGQFDTTLQWIRQQLQGESLRLEQLPLRELFQEAIKSMEVLLSARGVSVENLIPEDLHVHADREMLQFVNRNLLSNAFKFSPAGALITVGALPKDGFLEVSVSDGGPGIDEHLERRLFQIGTGDGSTHAGAGIALSLSREFIEAMGGTIYIKETGPQGSTFAYSLPVSGSSIHQ